MRDLRAAYDQQERALASERAARARAEADNAALIGALKQAERMNNMRGVWAVIDPVLADKSPGAALLAELHAARRVVAAARAWREAVETMDGVYSAELALIDALKGIGNK